MTCPKSDRCARKQAQLEAALKLRAEGYTLPRIAIEIGSSQAAVCKMLREGARHE